jgi:hypothetical protein
VEKDLQSPTITPTTPAQPAAGDVPAHVATPLHTQTQSTLAPTSEYVRYLLLGLPARYIPRGITGILFNTQPFEGGFFGKALARVADWSQKRLGIVGDMAERTAKANRYWAVSYNAAMGIGSLALTTGYSWTVYKDIKNIFAEAVAMETSKSPADVNSRDLYASDNRIVQKTMNNYGWRTAKRIFTDLLFFPAAMARSVAAGDLMVGGKALQAFGETWKRKTTMFEDLVTFINNKINPRNGLGQTINVGEVFDLYQHYAEAYNPSGMFTNVLERGTGEGALWAQSQPIFQRMTELMNLTYAYKHSSVIDPTTGHAVHQADFALPKFIYLLGHDLIDVKKPEQTLVTIEIANRFGIAAVKEMQTMVHGGATLKQVVERFPVEIHKPNAEKASNNAKNGVIPKGSTMQLDVAEPSAVVDANSISAHQTLGEGNHSIGL